MFYFVCQYRRWFDDIHVHNIRRILFCLQKDAAPTIFVLCSLPIASLLLELFSSRLDTCAMCIINFRTIGKNEICMFVCCNMCVWLLDFDIEISWFTHMIKFGISHTSYSSTDLFRCESYGNFFKRLSCIKLYHIHIQQCSDTWTILNPAAISLSFSISLTLSFWLNSPSSASRKFLTGHSMSYTLLFAQINMKIKWTELYCLVGTNKTIDIKRPVSNNVSTMWPAIVFNYLPK